MAKIAYSKLGLNKLLNKEPVIIEFNGQQIEVTQYLPMEKKLDLISDIVNYSIDNNNYYNPCRVSIYLLIETIIAYTNLTITEKQKEDVYKLYDQFIETGFSEAVLNAIPAQDYNFIYDSVYDTIENIYKQRNSALGILESISTDYSNLDFDATQIQQKLADPDNLGFLKEVLTKLG